jgi:sugar phosphate isomerase/epimerase
MATIRASLDTFAVPIADRLPGKENLGVGLWLPQSAANELLQATHAAEFGKWLRDRRLFPFTMNGFPFDNFHLPVVKHRVYLPTWADQRRLDYTHALARILADLHLAAGQTDASNVASISTLPIGWPATASRSSADDARHLSAAGANLRTLAKLLEDLESTSGLRIVVAIEPEPGCLLDRCEDVVDFFSRELPDASHRRYLTVCHDVCHSAVMFEDQAMALQQYVDAGIMIGKVQVSSAIDVPLGKMSPSDRAKAIAQLNGFAEDRYLHQTGCLDAEGRFRLVEDLPQWLGGIASTEDQHIRVHFHVPIFAEHLGYLRTTQDDIRQCVHAIQDLNESQFTGHWEVETYAWTVMPEELRADGLAADIERELQWCKALLSDSLK